MSVEIVRPSAPRPYVLLCAGVDTRIEARAAADTAAQRDVVDLRISAYGVSDVVITVPADEMFELLHAAIALNRGRA